MAEKQTESVERRRPSVAATIIGVIGEILITLGLLIFGFILWQVWWTGVIADREQSAAIDSFLSQVDGEGAAPMISGDTSDIKIGQSHRDEPPAFSGSPAHAETYGLIYVPRFGEDYVRTLAQGTDNQTVLDSGAFGHYENTVQVGELGNFSVAAHRTGAGDPLIHVDQLEAGDAVVVETAERYYVYKVLEHEIVLPTDVRVIASDPFMARAGETPTAEHRYMTITTCHPPFISNERWIVYSELDYWVDRSGGLPIDLVPLDQRPANWEETY